MKSIQSPFDFYKEMVCLWRVVLAVILAQLLAGGIAVIVEPFGFWFIDFWFGGAVVTFFGFIVGVVWQTRSVGGSWRSHREMLIFLGLTSLLLSVAAFLLPLDQAAAQFKEAMNSGHEGSV